jgi:FSR family fosmidomycin resistance protein-like MFS transporter
MVMRAFVSQSFQTFIPVLFVQEGYSLISAGAMIASFSLAGALGGLLAGYISDKIGYRSVFMGSFILTTPCLYYAYPVSTGLSDSVGFVCAHAPS